MRLFKFPLSRSFVQFGICRKILAKIPKEDLKHDDKFNVFTKNEQQMLAGCSTAIKVMIIWSFAKSKAPEKPYSGRFVLRVDPELHSKLHTEAILHHQSLNDFIQNQLQLAVGHG